MNTPIMKIQLTLEAGEEHSLDITSPHSFFRVRNLERDGEDGIDCEPGGYPLVIADGTSVRGRGSSAAGTVYLKNSSIRRLTLVIEKGELTREALSAERTDSLGACQRLRPDGLFQLGDDVRVDHVTIMFTDLNGSTALYERIGDPFAFALVRRHFAILDRLVRANDGMIINTIGDAMMAAFTNPADAFRSAVEIQSKFAEKNTTSGSEPFVIKLGLHVGHCISAALDDCLDYYGTTANMAARLQRQSGGGDIVMSREFVDDPTVAPLTQRYSLREEYA